MPIVDYCIVYSCIALPTSDIKIDILDDIYAVEITRSYQLV